MKFAEHRNTVLIKRMYIVHNGVCFILVRVTVI